MAAVYCRLDALTVIQLTVVKVLNGNENTETNIFFDPLTTERGDTAAFILNDVK